MPAFTRRRRASVAPLRGLRLPDPIAPVCGQDEVIFNLVVELVQAEWRNPADTVAALEMIAVSLSIPAWAPQHGLPSEERKTRSWQVPPLLWIHPEPLDLQAGDQVHLTVALAPAGSVAGGADAWAVCEVLHTPFDEDDPADHGVRRCGTPPSDRPSPSSGSLLGRHDALLDRHSLDYYRDFGSELVWQACPRFAHARTEHVDTVSGELHPACCHRLTCHVCVRVRALRVALAIGMSRPTHATVLTRLPPRWVEAHPLMRAFLKEARRLQPSLQAAYHLEMNRDGRKAHAHFWFHSLKRDESWLTATKSALGLAEYGELEAVRRPGGMAIGYGVKEALRGPTAARALLDLNGHRLVHGTRGFWRDQDGNTLKGSRAAEKVASRTSAHRKRSLNVR